MPVQYGGNEKTVGSMQADWQSHHVEGYARAAMEKGENGYFSAPLISEIMPNLYVGGCADQVMLPENIKFVLSLYKWEQYALPEGTERKEVTMYDAGEIPDVDQLNELADWVNEKRAEAPILVHCQAGLNRSNLITALALIKSGYAPHAAIALLREKRSPMVLCNQAFEDWLLTQGE